MDIEHYNLRPIWDALLDVYQEIQRICERHHLRYYACGGTALGAIRHKGFIPWDDDMDLLMPREDFRLFFDVYASELPQHLKAEDFHKKHGRVGPPLQFGKVFDVRKDVVERVSAESHLALGSGLFVDIIPIDGMPKATIPFAWWYFQLILWGFSMHPCAKAKWKVPFWRLCRKMLGVSSDPCENLIRYEAWLRKYNFDKSAAAEDINSSLVRKRRRALDARAYGTAVLYDFENVKMPVAEKTELFLTNMFGDWRKLPPEEQRIPSHQSL